MGNKDFNGIITACKWLKDYEALIDDWEHIEIALINCKDVPSKYYNLNAYIPDIEEAECRGIIKRGLEKNIKRREGLLKDYMNPKKQK